MKWFLLVLVLLVGCKTVTFAAEPPKTITVEIANDDSERARGLMYRQSLHPDTGMLFIFPDLNNRRFWMKNVKIDLDMIFLDSDFIVNEVKANLQPCQADPCPTYPSEFPAQYVVEVNGGFAEEYGIVPGTKATFS